MNLEISNLKSKWLLLYVMLIKKGKVVERFLSIVEVSNTSALSLKSALEALLAKYGLSLSRIHGQGYDGAKQHAR
jgi:hypothetical protein